MQELIVPLENIQSKIYPIRGKNVMLDRDLATLYKVSTKVFNQAVKRNIARFPDDFRFQLSKEEFSYWRSQIVTSNSDEVDKNLRSQIVTSNNGDKMGLRYAPYAFTEQGISMLSSILKSDVAIGVSIQIIRLFVQMRRTLSDNTLLTHRVAELESKQETTQTVVEKILIEIDKKETLPKEGIFYNGEIFDAYVFVVKLIKSAKKSLVLFDNYVDESVLTLLSKNQEVEIKIYTHTFSKQLQLDVKKYNEQYREIEVKSFKDAHDRFLVIDGEELYHLGASLKDLGKKWFAFSKMDIKSINILEKAEA